MKINFINAVASTQKILLGLLFVSFVATNDARAQLGKRIKDRTKEKAETKTEDAVDRSIDKSFDKLDQGLDRLFNGKKNKRNEQSSKDENQHSESAENYDNYNEEQSNNEENNTSFYNEGNESSTPSLQRYKGYTFVPGENIIAFEDFSNERLGDLPASWVSTGTAEVLNFDKQPGNWLWFNKTKGNFVPTYLKDFPEDFTIEFDLMFDFKFGTNSFSRLLMLVFSDISNAEAKLNWDGGPTYFTLQKLANNYTAIHFSGVGTNGGPFIIGKKAVSANASLNFNSSFKAHNIINSNNINTPIHIAIARNGRRMQVFANETKVLDITNAFEAGVKLTSARFFVNNYTETDNYYLTNIRYAAGKPDVRNKMLSSGSYSTSSITFNSGSADIKPESYAILKEIANALKAQPGKAITITGHTDSDGNKTNNQSLSERRAASVQALLQQEFGVDNTISVQGKGDTQPIADNQSATGKAKNRRVAFTLQ